LPREFESNFFQIRSTEETIVSSMSFQNNQEHRIEFLRLGRPLSLSCGHAEMWEAVKVLRGIASGPLIFMTLFVFIGIHAVRLTVTKQERVNCC
jgi:hypothetical protein